VTYVYAFDYSHSMPLADVTSLVGGKAANLGVMTSELGLPVPPGFVISTAACRQYLENGWPIGLDNEIQRHVAKIEAAVDRGFGDPRNPLLISVRSGAPISMPGMMDTILNLGLNDATTAALVERTGDEEFVTACRIRFVDMYADIVGEPAPEDPWQQLRGAVEAVFRSWNSPRAQSYRAREGIPDDLGTGVVVQTMVFGNLGADSATGVLFTRNPATGEAVLYGDLMFGAQGEDVVAGTHQTESLSVLDERMPEVARELRKYAGILERHYRDVCDIEFTIERGHLWMLQTRIGKRSPQAALRIAVEMAEDDSFPLTKEEAVGRVKSYLADPPLAPAPRRDDVAVLARGLGASPGVASGEIVTTPEEAARLAAAGKSALLVRRETSPDDVHGMAAAVGILTSTGGLASHAAVVARGWGIPAVVGAAAVVVDADGLTIDGVRYGSGELLTIDGATGEVMAGAVAGEATVVPEAAKLLAWAAELGIEIPAAETLAAEPAEATPAAGSRELSREAVVHTLLIKGSATGPDLGAILFAEPAECDAVLEDLVAAGLVATGDGDALAGMYRLTEVGRATGLEQLAADRAAWGEENAAAALDELLPFDARMKEIVTGWQMREVDGKQILNDHSDSGYDESVLGAFAALHQDAVTWLQKLAGGLPRLEAYVARFDRAAARVADGDPAYLASPRLDSFHNAWFELHEDLIQLAGRTREDEVAAGRA
jgi:pyruvate,orthophosphate dikinase